MTERKPDGPLSPLGIGVVAATVAVDQATKLIAERSLDYEQAIDLLPILSLYRVHNTGIAFSLLSGFGGIGLIGLTIAHAQWRVDNQVVGDPEPSVRYGWGPGRQSFPASVPMQSEVRYARWSSGTTPSEFRMNMRAAT